MSIKIAIPDNFIYKPLFFNAETVCKENNIQLIKDSEQRVRELFAQNKVNVAFLTPMGYGSGVKIADYRVVPVNVLAAQRYTRAASIFFNQNLTTINSCGTNTPNDYLMQIGKILLAERYGIMVDLKETKSNDKDEILEKHDSAMLWKKNFAHDEALDITDDWYESYEIPLILGSWVVRNEEEPKDIERILKLFESDSLRTEKQVNDMQSSEFDAREGKFLYEWNDEIEKAYDTILEVLFYHQCLDEMTSVKIMGDKLVDPSQDPAINAPGSKSEKS